MPRSVRRLCARLAILCGKLKAIEQALARAILHGHSKAQLDKDRAEQKKRRPELHCLSIEGSISRQIWVKRRRILRTSNYVQ